MTIDREIKVSILSVIIVTFSLFSVVWGETDVKETIIGKWERYDPKHKGKETMEFFKDKTVSLFHKSFEFTGARDYKFVGSLQSNIVKKNSNFKTIFDNNPGPDATGVFEVISIAEVSEYRDLAEKISDKGWGVFLGLKSIVTEALTGGILINWENGPTISTKNKRAFIFSYYSDKISFKDWLDYLAFIKEKYGPIERLTIYAHGNIGRVYLTKPEPLNKEKLKSDKKIRDQIERLKTEKILALNAHILLFSCLVGQDEDFIQELANITGAWVHANKEFTGNKIRKETDWTLQVLKAPQVVKPQITSSLRILESPPYKVGGIITAEFSIKNNGTAPITFDVLTVGGRVNDICPNDKCPDFGWKKDFTLKPNETYHYNGKLKPETPGDYHFFTAYKTKDGWNTAIPTAPGITNTIDILVKSSMGKSGSEVQVKECHPPTGKIAFVREIGNTQGGGWIDSEIFVMNADGTNEVRLTNNFVKDEDPNWSPDGRKIAFSSRSGGNSEVYVMNADGTGLMNLTKNLAHDAAPSWSPDGRKIAFQSHRDGSIEIYVMNADGSNQKRLTYSPPRNSHPRWSPDGSKIVFESFRNGGNPEIYVMNADGSNQTRLTYTGDNGGPDWSPDGRMIAFNSTRDGNYNIYLMNADGSNQRPLTNNPAEDYSPVWSPNGDWIAFVSSRDGNLEIYIMKADGSCQTRLTHNPALDYYPSFWTIRK